MNNKEIIVVGIQKARDEHEAWLDQARFLVKGKATHIVQKPMSHKDCDFGVWFYSEGQQFKDFSFFQEIESSHQGFHRAYAAIFSGAEKVIDTESHNVIKRQFSQLENQSKVLLKNLEDIKQALEGSEPDNFGQKNNIDQDKVSANMTSSTVSELAKAKESKPNLLRRQLKEQDLFQLQQEQQLTELELKQLEDRRELTDQGLQQVSQYIALKDQEIEQQLSEHNVLEEQNINSIYLGQQNITRLKEEIVLKNDELEQLELVDQKLDQRKAEEEVKERGILADFEKSQLLDKQDIVQLEKQREKWEEEAGKLKKQLALIEQDLENLAEKQKTKQLIIDESNQKKEVKLQELAQHSQLQDKLNGHKLRVKGAKQEELKQLEQEQSSMQKELKSLEIESATLENQKVDIGKSHKKELRQLNDQLRFKKMTIEKLESDKGRKKQELKEITHQKDAIQKSLDQMNTSETGTEKVLEEA